MSSAKCVECGKTAYWAEQQKFDDNIYHKLCLIKKKNEMSVNKNPEYPQNRPQGARVDVGIDPSNPTNTRFGSGLGSVGGGNTIESKPIGGGSSSSSNNNSSSSGSGAAAAGGARFCSQCGSARAGGAKFCPQCGKAYE